MDSFETADFAEGGALPEAGDEQDHALGTEDGAGDAPTDAVDAGYEEFDHADAEDAEDALEEIERNGRRATIPAWLKPELMMQADYTRKTQDLAEARRAFEAEQQDIREFSQAELSAHANLASINEQLAHYARVDWSAWNVSDPAAARAQFAHFQMLRNAQRDTAGRLESLRGHREAMTERETAQRFAEGYAELQRDVADWSPELASTLKDFGCSHYGFTDEDLDGADDPRAIKVLHAAYKWEQHQARQRQAQRHVAAQSVRPAAKVGGAAPKAGLDDRLSAEEWLRRRNRQVRGR